MRYLQRLLQATCFVSAIATLGGCASSHTGKLAVDLTAVKECQKLGGRVDVPAIRGSDFRVLSAESLATIKKANDGADARTGCENQVIDDYAKAN